MKPTEQAIELGERICHALAAMRRFERDGLDEPEVLFRLDSISGMLIIALQDIKGMIDEWRDEATSPGGSR